MVVSMAICESIGGWIEQGGISVYQWNRNVTINNKLSYPLIPSKSLRHIHSCALSWFNISLLSKSIPDLGFQSVNSIGLVRWQCHLYVYCNA